MNASSGGAAVSTYSDEGGDWEENVSGEEWEAEAAAGFWVEGISLPCIAVPGVLGKQLDRTQYLHSHAANHGNRGLGIILYVVPQSMKKCKMVSFVAAWVSCIRCLFIAGNCEK